MGSGSLEVRVVDPADRATARKVLERELRAEVRELPDPAGLAATVEATELALRAIAALDTGGIALAQFSLGQPTLDEVFLSLTGHQASDESEKEAVA